MSDDLPPPVPEPAPPPSTEAEEDAVLFGPPRRAASWRRWVVIGLVLAVVLALGTAAVLVYVAGSAWGRRWRASMGYPQYPPATPKGKGPFEQVARFKTDDYVQAISSGDVDGDGKVEAVVWIGTMISIRDQTGKEKGSFASHLRALDQPPVSGSWVRVTPGGGIRRPRIGTMQGRPAIAVTDGENESVFVYRPDGTLALNNKVKYSHVRCLQLADLDGDGEDEMLVGRSSGVGLVCVDAKGKTKWKHGAATDPRWAEVGDGNGDGKPEVFVGYETSAPHLLNAEGRRIGEWTKYRLECAVRSADLDHDGKLDFLIGVSPQPTASGTQGLMLEGVGADGSTVWDTSLQSGSYAWSWVTHLASADLNADGQGEWIASSPDGTVGIYDKAGKEIGRYAMGQDIQTLGVVGPNKEGEKPELWVSLGQEVVILKWR